MNVIVANKKSTELSNLDIDIIKNVNGEYSADELVTMFKDFFFNKMILDITAVKGYESENSIKKIAGVLGADKIILVLTDEVCSKPDYLSNIISMGIYNFTNNINAIKQLIETPNTYENVVEIQKMNAMNNNNSDSSLSGLRVLGIRNVTDHAGATTLAYMIKNELVNQYGNSNSVCALEIDKKDMIAFNDKMMKSVRSAEIERVVRELGHVKAVVVDLNDYNDDSFCDEVIYLFEPSSLMINKLIRKNRNIFEKLKGKKIVLNKSMLTNKDVTEFEYEANIKVYYNMPPLDERKRNPMIFDLLSKIGFTNDTASVKGEGSKIFGIFKH